MKLLFLDAALVVENSFIIPRTKIPTDFTSHLICQSQKSKGLPIFNVLCVCSRQTKPIVW